MAFKIKSEAERAAEAAMTPRDKEVASEKEAFMRIAQAVHADDRFRADNSPEHRIVTLGEHPSAYFNAPVRDHDGGRRDAFVLELHFHDDGAAITHANVDRATTATYWASRADGEQHRGNDGFDKRVGLGDMMVGEKVSMLGRSSTTPARGNAPERRRFVATEVMHGEHSAEELRARGRGELSIAAEAFMKAPTAGEKDAIASAYAESVVAGREATAAKGIMAQADAVELRSPRAPSLADGLGKGPSTSVLAAAASKVRDNGR